MIGSILTALFLRVGGTFLWLGLSALLARNLSVEGFGSAMFFISVVLALGGIVVLGYDITVMRFASVFWRDGNKEKFRGIFEESVVAVLISSSFTLVFMILLTFFNIVTPVTIDLETAIMSGIAIALTALMAVFRDTLRAADRLQAALIGQSVFRAAIPLALCGAAVLLDVLSVRSFLVSYIIGLAAALLWQGSVIARLDLPRQRFKGFPNFNVAIAIWPGDAALLLFQRGAGIGIGLVGGLEAAAIFLAAERIAQLGTFLIDAVRTVVSPLLARTTGSEARQDAVSRSSLLVAGSGILGSILLVFLGGALLILFGPEYRDAFPVLMVLLIGQASWIFFGPISLILNMFGLQSQRSLISIACTVAFLCVLPFCGTPLLAAWAFSLTAWIMNFCQWLLLRRRLGLSSGLIGIRKSDLLGFMEQEASLIRTLRARKMR